MWRTCHIFGPRGRCLATCLPESHSGAQTLTQSQMAIAVAIATLSIALRFRRYRSPSRYGPKMAQPQVMLGCLQKRGTQIRGLRAGSAEITETTEMTKTPKIQRANHGFPKPRVKKYPIIIHSIELRQSFKCPVSCVVWSYTVISYTYLVKITRVAPHLHLRSEKSSSDKHLHKAWPNSIWLAPFIPKPFSIHNSLTHALSVLQCFVIMHQNNLCNVICTPLSGKARLGLHANPQKQNYWHHISNHRVNWWFSRLLMYWVGFLHKFSRETEFSHRYSVQDFWFSLRSCRSSSVNF